MSWDPTIAATAFGTVFLAQLPGKSALTAFVLATRYRTIPVLVGAATALAIHAALAVVVGGALATLPTRPVHMGAGAVFLVSAIFMWRSRPAEDVGATSELPHRPPTFLRATGSTFALVFLTEWGDLTQVATVALAARFVRPVMVFIGATLGLWAATALAALAGRGTGAVLKPEAVRRIAAIVFAMIGAALLVGLL